MSRSIVTAGFGLAVLTGLSVLPAAALAQSWDNVAHPGGTLPGSPAISLVKVAEGFNDPVAVVSARDGSGRLFVVERVGRVKILKAGKTLPEPFLDLTGAALPLGGEVQTQFIEQGLYSIAFHPNFKQNGYVYVHYASLPFNGDGYIVRFKVSAKNPDKVDPESARVIYVIDQPWYNHNGGQLVFGPDGYLYIGSGDGGWEGDPLGAGQDLTTNLGKLLRIDVNTEGNPPYKIPETNPLVWKPQLMALFGVTDQTFATLHPTAKPEIWAYGVRNPWSFHFDSRTGDLYVSDVGQSELEAIYFQPSTSKGGENYGWKSRFGTACFPMGSKDCPPRFGTPPAAEYSHKEFGCALMSFGIYRGTQYAKLDGVYFTGDWCTGRVFGLKKDAAGKWQFQALANTGLNFQGGGQDENGDVYAVNCHCFYTTDKGATGNPPGEVYKIVQSDMVPAGAAVAPNKGTGN